MRRRHDRTSSFDDAYAILAWFEERELEKWLRWFCHDGEIGFHVGCSDFFIWGSADAEFVTVADLEEISRAFGDVRSATSELSERDRESWSLLLYCARKRQARPQGAAYPRDPALIALFDGCGPERKTGLGNPKPQPHV